jgi:hypothetical protein
LRISVSAADAGDGGSAASYLRRNLAARCVALRFFFKVATPPTSDLFLGLVSGPRLDGGGGSGAGANVDVRLLLDPQGRLLIGEQISGGDRYTELGRVLVQNATWHELTLYVSAAGPTLEVQAALDGTEIPMTGTPQLAPSGQLKTLILGPSYAHATASTVLFYDDVSLR